MAGRDDDAPWLAEAEPAQAPRGISGFWKLVIALTGIALVALVLVLLLGRRDTGSTEGYMEAAQAPLIEADPGPYKTVPTDPRGLDVPGEGEMIYEAGQGAAPTSVIDPNAVPEEPIGRPRDLLPQGADPAPAAPAPAPATAGATPPQAPAPMAAPAPAAKPLPAKPVAAPPPPPKPPVAKANTPAPVPVPPPKPPAAKAQAGLVQLGAFSSRAKAESEWARLAGRAMLSGRSIDAIERDGQTLYRLRGTAGDIAAACAAVQAARGACAPVK